MIQEASIRDMLVSILAGEKADTPSRSRNAVIGASAQLKLMTVVCRLLAVYGG
jgi:hypothetical protein